MPRGVVLARLMQGNDHQVPAFHSSGADVREDEAGHRRARQR